MSLGLVMVEPERAGRPATVNAKGARRNEGTRVRNQIGMRNSERGMDLKLKAYECKRVRKYDLNAECRMRNQLQCGVRNRHDAGREAALVASRERQES